MKPYYVVGVDLDRTICEECDLRGKAHQWPTETRVSFFFSSQHKKGLNQATYRVNPDEV